jgi:hypothetical protein
MMLAAEVPGGAALLPSLAALAGGLVAAWLAYRQSTRVAKIAAGTEAQRISGAEYDRARALMESGNARLLDEIGRLETKIRQLREDGSVDARRHTEDRIRIDELERHVARMQLRLIRAGIEDTNGAP